MSTISIEVADFVALIEARGRRLYVAEDLIDLTNLERSNNIYVVELGEGSVGAENKNPKITKACHYLLGEGNCMKIGEFEDELRLEALELPDQTASFKLRLPDGKQRIVYGKVDIELVASYKTILEQT